MTAQRTQRHAAARGSRGHGATPEAVRAAVLADLLAGRSTDTAAGNVGIEGSTVRRWLADDPTFATAYADGLAAIQAATIKQLIAAKAVAVEVLVREALAGDVSAARALLAHGEPIRATALVVGAGAAPTEPNRAEVLAAVGRLVRSLRESGAGPSVDEEIRRALALPEATR